MRVRFVCAVVAIVFGFPGHAQSTLGFTGTSLELASTEDEASARRVSLAASVDVRVTQDHGLQGHLSFSETATGTIGQLGAHLYMAPRIGQKYGLFVSLADMDGRSMAWASAGAEGMYEASDTTLLAGYVGLGAADGNSLDYIFGGASVVHAVSPSLHLEAAFDVADFDEAAFRATSIETSISAHYRPKDQPWRVFARVTQSDLTGRDGGADATRIGFGLTFDFGASGGVRSDTRHFREINPVAPLIRRGLW